MLAQWRGVMLLAPGAVIVAALWWRWQRGAAAEALPRARASWHVVAASIACGVGVRVADDTGPLLGAPGVLEGTVQGIPALISTLLVAGILAPIAEETVFRGLLLPRLRRYGGPITSVGLAAAASTLAHLGAPHWLLQLAAGLLAGAILVATGRLWLSVAARAGIGLADVLWTAASVAARSNPGILPRGVGLALALVAALELRRVLRGTRWRIPPNPADRVAPPVTWGVDFSRVGDEPGRTRGSTTSGGSQLK